MKSWLPAILLVAAGCLSFSSLSAQKERDPEKIAFINLENLITKRVEQNMTEWLAQGEFEPSDAYQTRINNRDLQIEKFTVEAIQFYKEKHLDKIDFASCRVIGKYDPDAQTFKIYCSGIGEFIVPVPLEDAPGFKENQKYLTYSSPQFVIRDNAWILSYLEIEHHGNIFKYDIANNATYNPKDDFHLAMNDLNITLPSSGVIQHQNANYAYQNLDEDYSISKNLPESQQSNPDAIAVVIGNRNYKKTRWVEYAGNDAQAMSRYLKEVLGFKSNNIFILKNATKGDFDTWFGTEGNHKGKLFNAVKAQKSDVFVFYSGHGAPGLNDKKGYFVPIECDPNNVELGGYSLNLFYKNLSKIPAKSKTVIVDACFSGAEILDNISPIGIRVDLTGGKDMVVMTSSAGTQVSSWYNAKHHGLFTYFFLKAIHDYELSDTDKDGELTYQEVYDYLSNQDEGLPYFARRLHGIEQTPKLQGQGREQVLLRY